MKRNLVKSMSVALLMGGAMTFAACSSDDESVTGNNERKDVALTRAEQVYVSQNNDFAFRLLREMQDGQSQILSPLGITFTLGMLNNGATGETQEEINKVLGFEEAGAEGINMLCQKLLLEAPNLDRKVELNLANNIFVNKKYQLQPAFVQTAQEFYEASPTVCDFSDGTGALKTINGWVSKQTKGQIDQLLKEVGPDDVFYIVSAAYFNGMWKDKFSKSETNQAAFYEGKKYLVQMMHRSGKYYYTESEDFQALSLPYGNEAFSMTVLLPQKGKSLSDMLSLLNGGELSLIHSSMKEITVDVKIPTFETKTDVDLIAIMQKLGMSKAFTQEAEFQKLCNVDTEISKFKQSSRIKVDEEGTEVVSATYISGERTAFVPQDRVDFHADHPFVYVISEKSTGAIFFIGSYFGD